jgi:RNA polymerase sigma factor (sigma-70 family)
MGTGIRGGGAARAIQALLDAGAIGSMGDGELIGRFLRRDDSAGPAFAALVDRHGRMVLRVCRDVLGDPHEAQDAAQATFFILARKAAAIRQPEALPSWLHGTARRVASRALRESIRRRRHERKAAEVSSKSSDSDDDSPKGWPELHEELARLPDRYREPIVLCDLSGLTHEQAAGKLGCPARTLETRLYRGRERLKDRLVRRGLAPSAALVGVAWSSEAWASPPAWVASTARVAVLVSGEAGWAAAGEVSAVAARWARIQLKEIGMFKLKLIATAGVLIGLAAGGAWSGMSPGEGGHPSPKLAATPPAAVVDQGQEPKDAFERAYALADGEDVKLLLGPAIEARNEHFRGKGKEIGMGADPGAHQGALSLVFRWGDGRRRWAMSMTGGGDAVELRSLLFPLLGIRGQEIEGDQALIGTQIAADVLVREGVPAEKMVTQLETILRRDVHLPARLSVKTVFRDVVVVKGRYKYRKAENLKPAPNGMTSGGDRIEISAGELGGEANPKLDRFSSGGDFSGLLSELGQFLGRRVVDESKNGPNGRFDFCITDCFAKKELGPEERARVLKNLADQTGLNFVEEPREIRVLKVERAE